MHSHDTYPRGTVSIKRIETLIIGGDQVGPTMSHQLSRRGLPHVVSERGQITER